MDLLRKIAKGVLGTALWVYVFAVLFIEGTYVPFISDTKTPSATTASNPPKPTSSPPPIKAQKPSAPKVMPEIYAMALYQIFNSDDQTAKRKYEGKTIIVSGLHFSLQENVFSQSADAAFYVNIEEQTGWLDSKSVVKCEVSKAIAESIRAVENPSMIKLKGRVETNYLRDEVNLERCALVSMK